MTRLREVLTRLNRRMGDARQLLDIHTSLTGEGRGRRFDVDALNRGAVIMSVAAWEAFVEDLAMYSARHFSLGLSSASRLPDHVRDPFLCWLHGTTDFRTPTPEVRQAMWSITGQGWKKKFREYASHTTERFHTPAPNNVRRLFKALLGIEDLTDAWGYRRWGADIYRQKLDQTLLLRHRIAHGSIGDETVGKTRARDAIGLVTSLSQRSFDEVQGHLRSYNLNFRRRRRAR